MTYLYECTKCKSGEITIIKPMSESNRAEYCGKCKTLMQRVFKLAGIKTNDNFKL